MNPNPIVEKCNSLVNFKASETQVQNYANASRAAGLRSRSQWIKRELDRAVRRLRGKR